VQCKATFCFIKFFALPYVCLNCIFACKVLFFSVQVPVAPCYVDLHGQINKPITKSPLLMSCYANHMTQLACSNWSVRAPQPASRCAADRGRSAVAMLTAVGIPHFSYVSEGFTPGLMVERLLQKSPRLLRSPTRTDPKQKRFFADTSQNNNLQTDGGELLHGLY